MFVLTIQFTISYTIFLKTPRFLLSMAKKRTSARLKVKKKSWVPIMAPKSFGNKEIGEIYVVQAENGLNRTVQSNLRDITGNVKDQNVSLTFTISNLKDNRLQTSLLGYTLSNTLVKRMVRKGVDRIDELYTFKSKDGSDVLLKVLAVTLHNTSRSVRKAIRLALMELMKNHVANHSFDDLVNKIIGYSIQSELKKKLSKIYPIREVSFRVVSRVKGSQKVAEPKETPVESETVPEVAKVETPEESETVQETVPADVATPEATPEQ
ncbi:MAG: hypothetical protein CMH61_01375 [Nanoarchaeota archaeon]|nr:hypothetical protein [Nanoarchaeota archaeon]|tara:strand:+ start:3760 stop:4557 length:798 start_codon:yes stop_codon:yes gene_type:complete